FVNCFLEVFGLVQNFRVTVLVRHRFIRVLQVFLHILLGQFILAYISICISHIAVGQRVGGVHFLGLLPVFQCPVVVTGPVHQLAHARICQRVVGVFLYCFFVVGHSLAATRRDLQVSIAHGHQQFRGHHFFQYFVIPVNGLLFVAAFRVVDGICRIPF